MTSAPSPSPRARRRASAPTPAETVKLGLLGDLIGFRLRRIQNQLAETFRERLAGRDLKSGEFSTLAIIAANPGISQIDLAEAGGFDRTSVVGMLDDLERWGWAVRVRAENDRRRHSLTITPLGESVLKELHAIALDNEAIVTGAMNARERQQLYETLDRLYAVFFSEKR